MPVQTFLPPSENASAQTDEGANASTKSEQARRAHGVQASVQTAGKRSSGVGCGTASAGSRSVRAGQRRDTGRRTHTSITPRAAPRHMKNARGELQRAHLFTRKTDLRPGVSLATLREYPSMYSRFLFRSRKAKAIGVYRDPPASEFARAGGKLITIDPHSQTQYAASVSALPDSPAASIKPVALMSRMPAWSLGHSPA